MKKITTIIFSLFFFLTLFLVPQAQAALLVSQPTVSSGDNWTVNYNNGQTFEFDMNFSGQWPVLLCKNSSSGSVGIWFQGNEVYVKTSGGFTKDLGGINSGSNTHYKVVCNNNDVFVYAGGNLVGNANDSSINVSSSNFVNNPRADFVANGYTQMTNFTISDTEQNVAPTITSLIVPTGTQSQNTPIGIIGEFTDTSASDTHTATVDWGDGHSSSGTIIESNGSGSVTGSHSYSQGGDYTIKLTVTDQDGASSRREAQVHVNFSPNIYRIQANGSNTYSATGYFSDSDSTSWTGSVNYGDGSGSQTLQIDGQNHTFSLNHSYITNDNFTITIAIIDNQAQSSSPFLVKSNLFVLQPNVYSGDSWITNYSGGQTFEFDMNFSGQWPVLTCKNSSSGYVALWFQGNEVYVKTSSGFVKDLGGISSGSNTHYKVVCNNNDVFLYAGGNLVGNATDSSIYVPPTNDFTNESHVGFIANGDTRMTNLNIYSSNLSPSVNTISNAEFNEGDTYTATGSFVDSDSTSWTATVNYGDGSGEQSLLLNGKTFSLNHTYSVAGTYTVTVKVTDNQGAIGTQAATITVKPRPNEAPVIANIPNSTVNQDDTYVVSGTFTDSDSSSWTATVDYGDGAGAVNLPLNPDKTFSLNHQYTTTGTYTVTVVVTDSQGATGTTMATVTVNASPQISGLSNTEINFQDDFIQNGSFTDPDSTSWTATVDYGDGFGVHALSLNADHSFNLDRIYPAAGVYSTTVTVTDNQGATGTANIMVKVNAPAHINQLLGATINEGQAYTENGLFSDTDSTSWTGVVNYGDGSGSQSLTLNPDNTFSLSHLYQDNGTYTVLVTITDDQGAIGTKTATVTVNNASSVVGVITVSSNPVQTNTSITTGATFTDPGVLDTHTAVWNWGDGSAPQNGTVIESNGSGSVLNSHTYTTAGVYAITLTVTDNNGAVGTQTFQYISVYNPTSQGLFSAGQKYISPTGAYAANPSLTGTVKFGLSYKYQGTVPTGHKAFSMDFNQANLHFNATTVSSLVISNGIGALTGTGTINGSSTYTFLITGDENANTIRIQIKDQSGNTIYDTQPGSPPTAAPTTPITAGNVLAH